MSHYLVMASNERSGVYETGAIDALQAKGELLNLLSQGRCPIPGLQREWDEQGRVEFGVQKDVDDENWSTEERVAEYRTRKQMGWHPLAPSAPAEQVRLPQADLAPSRQVEALLARIENLEAKVALLSAAVHAAADSPMTGAIPIARYEMRDGVKVMVEKFPSQTAAAKAAGSKAVSIAAAISSGKPFKGGWYERA